MVDRCARTIGAGGVQGMDERGGMRVVLGRAGGRLKRYGWWVGRGGCGSGSASPDCRHFGELSGTLELGALGGLRRSRRAH